MADSNDPNADWSATPANPVAESQGLSHLLETWHTLYPPEKLSTFRSLSHDDAEDLWLSFPVKEQAELIRLFSRAERRLWTRFLAPDDAADLVQELTGEIEDDGTDLKAQLLDMVDQSTRKEIVALLSYREDEAGGLMSTRYVRVRAEMQIAEAIRYVRQQALVVDPAHYVYVLDSQQVLLGILSLREIFVAPADRLVADLMEKDILTVPEEMDQEQISQLFVQHRYSALPVVDSERKMKGVVTFDDILDVSREEATEDIQKFGGVEALDAPYMQVPLGSLIRKRAVWLVPLFFGETLTSSAMRGYQDMLAQATVLALFIPLIISSGGNAGSQASTLVIRALALKEIQNTDWLRILGRELLAGVSLGVVLATLGALKILIWPHLTGNPTIYTDQVGFVSLAVGLSLVGVVLYGTLVGSMLPFVLKKVNLDPASASAPLVATLVDVTGLVIYFTISGVILSGRLINV
jgi:magnesium transporter